MFTDATSSLPIYSVRAFSVKRHHYPFTPFGCLVMKRHHYPLIPCAPCSGKSRFDLVYIPYILNVGTLLPFPYLRTSYKDALSGFFKIPAGARKKKSWFPVLK